jgi:hypothetical protein
LKCIKWNIGNLLKIFVRGDRVVRVCCLMLHVTLTKNLNCVIVDGHFIAVYHGRVVITNEIGSYEFVGMKKEIFLLNEFLRLANMVHLVREWLGWMDE